jgi:hypothetical protein
MVDWKTHLKCLGKVLGITSLILVGVGAAITAVFGWIWLLAWFWTSIAGHGVLSTILILVTFFLPVITTTIAVEVGPRCYHKTTSSDAYRD